MTFNTIFFNENKIRNIVCLMLIFVLDVHKASLYKVVFAYKTPYRIIMLYSMKYNKKQGIALIEKT